MFDDVGFVMRLLMLLEDSKMTKTEFATQMGVSREIVSMWVNGHRYPNLERTCRIADIFGCSLNWLLLGKGERYL